MKNFSELVGSSLKTQHANIAYSLDDSWMQGRAIYGGLSASLCLDATMKTFADLPPLRSANVNFVGPGASDIWVEVKELRRGKSVAFIQANLVGEDGLITSCTFSFGASRESRLAENYGQTLYGSKHRTVSPEKAEAFFDEENQHPDYLRKRPVFTQHFDARLMSGGRPFQGAGEPSFEMWVKHKDIDATSMAALVAVADMPPPAIVPVFDAFAPISSMTWMFNLLTDDISNKSGWWLLGSFAEHVSQGYSSQNMTIHNDQGELVMVGRQNVAVFY